MPLFLVTSKKGMALVSAESALMAKCDVLDEQYVDEPSDLNAIEVDLSEMSEGIKVLLSFQDGSREV